jgi:hypothetical protein
MSAAPVTSSPGINSTALAHIAVGVIVERHRAKSPWLDFIWRPAAVLAGIPEAAPWTPLGEAEDTTLFYAGDAVIELYRTDRELPQQSCLERTLIVGDHASQRIAECL